MVTGYDDRKAREPIYEESCAGCGHEAGDCRCPPETEAICGWCGQPWDEIEDHEEPCAEGVIDTRTGEGGFIGPHEKKVVPVEPLPVHTHEGGAE